MENNYYNNLEENFDKAIELFESNLTKDELINFLKFGNITQRQISAIKLDSINSEYEASVLTNNLTGQDGKIREVVSYKIAEFSKNPTTKNYFMNANNYQKFLDALTDINGNICRNTLQIISNFIKEQDFIEYFLPKLEDLTDDLIDKVLLFGDQDGKYKVNKDSFKLYWCLEAIYIFANKIEEDNLIKILKKAANVRDYTIREKVAKILTKDFCNSELLEIKEILKNDSNYYVRRY